MGKILLLTIILVMATVISIESSEIRSEMVGPVYDSWKCPSCGWENGEDSMRCKICGRYK